jgi:prepilin-type N-terminal cleavage/methylation domain-containing protein
MTLMQAYLKNPHTRAVLSRKPREEGFSLIELVIVVTVLAILAAVAIPAFTNISNEARVSGAKSALANLVKECAVKLAGNGPYTYVTPTLNSYIITQAGGVNLTCSDQNTYTATAAAGIATGNFTIVAATGAKTCAGGNGLGCNAGTW